MNLCGYKRDGDDDTTVASAAAPGAGGRGLVQGVEGATMARVCGTGGCVWGKAGGEGKMSGKRTDEHADSYICCVRTNARMSPIILLIQIQQQQQPNYEHELCIHSSLSTFQGANSISHTIFVASHVVSREIFRDKRGVTDSLYSG